VDAGDNSAELADDEDLDGDGNLAEPLPFDLAGLPRFSDVVSHADSGNGAAPIVDMGAYETHVFVSSCLWSSGNSLLFPRFLLLLPIDPFANLRICRFPRRNHDRRVSAALNLVCLFALLLAGLAGCTQATQTPQVQPPHRTEAAPPTACCPPPRRPRRPRPSNHRPHKRRHCHPRRPAQL